MLDASVRVGDRQITAGVSAAGYEGSVWLRQEGDATRAQLKWQYSRNSKMQHFYQLETAIGGDRMMFKAGSYSRYMLQDAPYWEVGLDMRPGQFSGSLYNRRTQASFLWTPGLLKASSNYRMSGLTTDTQILVRDVTQQGVDYNVTQIDWDQKLIYQDEVIEKKYVYTARSAVEQDVLHVDIDGPNGWKAEASFAVMEDAAKLDELLGIGAEAAAPQTVAEPTVEPTVEPEATKAPVNGVFLSGPKK